MSVLFRIAIMSGEGGRATEEGSSAMVNGRCHRDATGMHCRASTTFKKIKYLYVFLKFVLQKECNNSKYYLTCILL